MKIRMKTVAGLLIILAFSRVAGQDLTADDIIARSNELMNQPTVTATTKMTITTTSGQEREFIFESYAKNKGEKSLMKYIAPKRVKGQTILMLNNADDIWAYFPRTNRVRKLATHAKKQKMEGSDFSYEDMGSGDAWLNEFTSSLLDDDKIDGSVCYKLELLKNENSDSGYSRLLMWIDKESYMPMRIDYFDEDDPQLHKKRLTISDIREIDNILTPMKMVMTDVQNDTDTVMEYEKISYGEELDDDLFTERGMKR
ncbi:MAG: outer membrane lipoprotein-sorting protein [candidate division Zixibacteria bacterium]